MAQARAAAQRSDNPKAAPKGKKKGDPGIVHEDMFGKSFSATDPKQGLRGIKIRADNVENIPGTVEHWKSDIANRKKDILEYAGRSFMQRAMSIVKKDSLSDEITGEELAKNHPVKRTEEFVRTLKADPKDSLSRLQLVSAVGKVGREFPVEVYRSMLLQAMTACSIGELSTQGLQIAAWSQNNYFTKLFSKCKETLEKVEKTLASSSAQGEGGYADQRSSLNERKKEIQRNMRIIRLYQMHTSKGMKESPAGGHCALSYEEIKQAYVGAAVEGAEDQRAKDTIVKKLTAIINMLRYIMLLHDTATELVDLFIQMDGSNPIGHFLKARVSMSALIFSVSRYEGGERTPQTKQKIQDTFKDAYHQYGVAASKVGSLPKGETQYAILIEYANVILYFYRTATTTLGITLPKAWIQGALTKAHKALMMAQESGKTEELQKQVLESMKREGILA